MSKSPDEVVAERIIDAFRTEKLMCDPSLKALAPLLVKGSLRSEDWRVYIEKEVTQAKGSADATKN